MRASCPCANDKSSCVDQEMSAGKSVSNGTSDEVSDCSGSGQLQLAPVKRKRNLPGTPDPEAEVVALSPQTLMATNRFVCEICSKGFQRDQNLQLHRRGHNLPWKLQQRSGEARKRVYVCPESACIHHHPSRALGDLTGIKKHFFRKHGEKTWKCAKCSKHYAVQSDWKAHQKICGTRDYRCPCGTIFSRKDSFQTHKATCEALLLSPSTPPELANNTPSPNGSKAAPAMPLARDKPSPVTAPIPEDEDEDAAQAAPLLSLSLDASPLHSADRAPHLNPTFLRAINPAKEEEEKRTADCSSSSIQDLFPFFRALPQIHSISSSSSFSSSFSTQKQQQKQQRRISGAAPLSATASLQKATEMGLTLSNPSLTRGLSSMAFGNKWVDQNGVGVCITRSSSTGGGSTEERFQCGDEGVMNTTTTTMASAFGSHISCQGERTGLGYEHGRAGPTHNKEGGGGGGRTTLDFLGVGRDMGNSYQEARLFR